MNENRFAPKGPQTPEGFDGIKLLRWLNIWQAVFLERGLNPTMLIEMSRRVQYDMRVAARELNHVKFITAAELEQAKKQEDVVVEEPDAKKQRTEA